MFHTGKLLQDGKPLSGKGRLSGEKIDKFQTYYGKAIRNNKGNVSAMATASKAILWHNTEFDPQERHQFCPVSNDSWCKYQQEISEFGASTYTPKNGLPKVIHDVCLPTFQFLSQPEFLEGCKKGLTQNQNESLHNTIWSFVPKHQRHSANEVSVGLNLGIMVFNTGFQNTLSNVMDKLELSVLNRSVHIMKGIE